ncbi:hypothetical protein [Pseudopedobacter sp.]|uniref:hypothetical protein n=1 Tax=Pseudopedobacter sp. TaxID=1936787 RepID=UPI003342AED9
MMKKNSAVFLLFTLGMVGFQARAQWTESGNLKNVSWEYTFAGSGTVTNADGGIEKISTSSKADFLPKPSSGEVRIIGTDELGTGRASFTLNNIGSNSSLTMVHTSGKAFQAAPAKFVAKDFAAKSKVMSAHFNITPNSSAENVQAIWYIVAGAGANANISGKNAPAISGYQNTDNGIYTLIRFRKSTAGGAYGLQARYNSGDEKKWGWKTIPGATLTNGVSAKIDLFFNNTDSPQSYTFNGAEKTLEAASYHVYINGAQKGATLKELTRNISTPGSSTLRYTGDLNGFGIMSREGAHSNKFESDGTTRAYDNSASLTISNLKIVHLATAK